MSLDLAECRMYEAKQRSMQNMSKWDRGCKILASGYFEIANSTGRGQGIAHGIRFLPRSRHI